MTTAGLAGLLERALKRSRAPICSTTGERFAPCEVREAAQRVASALRSFGLIADEPVLVVIGNRPADVAAMLGVWRAGALAVPVHISAAESTWRSLREATAARLSVDGERVAVVGAAAPPARSLLRGGAVVVFTSGTTGRPKGVVLGHEQLSGKLAVLDRLLRFGPADVVVVPLQLTFIFGLWVSLLAILAGARLVLVPRFSSEAVAAELCGSGTVLAAVPSMLRPILADGEVPSAALRMILAGGETLGVALAEAVSRAMPSASIFDLYGLTETGSCDFCSGSAGEPPGLGSIGLPTDGVTFRLEGQDCGATPPGASGELQIKTPFGMLGYLDDPDATERAFSEGFFKTGDIARQRSDGRLELVGRSKEIISRGGNKIAPLEVDNLLASHPDVAAALCAGVPDQRLGESIRAVVVLRRGAQITPDDLRKWAAERIERFKVPDAIAFRDSLPVGSTGKASRSAISAARVFP